MFHRLGFVRIKPADGRRIARAGAPAAPSILHASRVDGDEVLATVKRHSLDPGVAKVAPACRIWRILPYRFHLVHTEAQFWMVRHMGKRQTVIDRNEPVRPSNHYQGHDIHVAVTHWLSRPCLSASMLRCLWPLTIHCLVGMTILSAVIGCSPRIVAEGIHTTLPVQGTLVGVWGTHPAVEHTAILWLRKRGLRVMDPAEIRVNLSGESTTSLVSNEESILEVAERHGLREVVFVRLVGDQRAPAVLVRALTLPERHVAWVGSARYEDYLSKPTVNHLVVAVCRALGAAWDAPALSDSERCGIDHGD